MTGEPWIHDSWAGDQPNDSGGRPEDKLQYGWGPIVSTWNDIMSIDPNPSLRPVAYVTEQVPEPSTIVLLAMGAIGLLAYAWRRKRVA